MALASGGAGCYALDREPSPRSLLHVGGLSCFDLSLLWSLCLDPGSVELGRTEDLEGHYLYVKYEQEDCRDSAQPLRVGPCHCVPHCTHCPAPRLVHRKVSKCLSYEWMWQFVKPGYKTTLQVLIHFAREEMQGQFCSKGILQESEDRWPSVSFPCVCAC